MQDPDYASSLEAWRAERLAKLAAEDGWLNLVGRWELASGSHTLGAADDNDIVLPLGPAHVGILRKDASGLTFLPADGSAPKPLVPEGKQPVRFGVDRLLLEVTTLNDDHALRARDIQSSSRENPPEIPHYPVDPAWRIVARWVPLDAPMPVTVDTMIGIPTEVTVTHQAVFDHGGTQYRLIPTYGTPMAPQFVFRDRTAGETYPASRFVFGEDIEGGSIVIDFNKAINPPCAFTEFAVCPLPLPGNILPFRIEAGEKKLPD